MASISEITTRGELVLGELREFLKSYLSRPNAMSLSALARKIGVSHVSLLRFRDGGGIRFDNGIELANAIGFDLSKFLTRVH